MSEVPAIAYIGSFKKQHDERGIAEALEKHMLVYKFEESTFCLDDINMIANLDIDFVLFAKLKVDYETKGMFFRIMKNFGIKTVCYVPDLFIGLSRELTLHAKYSIFNASLVCTPDGGHDEKWKQHGINHKLLRQGIPADQIYRGDKTERPYKIVFVGSQNPEFPYRNTLTARLKERYGSLFRWVGKHYSDECRGKDLNDLYASVPIVVGDSLYSPHYWSNRIYETIGRGGFIIHPVIEGLDQEFIPGKHFVPYYYNDFEGLFKQIDYYLEHEEEREQIVTQGMAHVSSNHTLDHRVTQLLDYVRHTVQSNG